ncbi:DUF84 family protein [Candidatus Pacearchaeota archaeon]|nr:DUF84 family protein [Candidatus Pacearchaeota archaeon]
MRIAVTSESKIKLDAVINAYSFMSPIPEIVGYSTNSGVGEQPVGVQTLVGARNRIDDLKRRINDYDLIISIENGIFPGDQWEDRAVVIIYHAGRDKRYTGQSEPVVFPDEYVKVAQERGFIKHTVAEVMKERGYIENAKDPHETISGIPRQEFLEDTLKELIERIEESE